jgi:hypothetical protein
MKKSQQLLKEIIDLTYKIEINYPELYQFLDENPITIPEKKNPNITNGTLELYLTSLQELFTSYKKMHLKRKL